MTVVAIIGILATLSLGPIRAAQQRGRDTQRKSDLNLIAQALDVYYADKRSFPDCSATGGQLTSLSASGGEWIPGLSRYIIHTKGRSTENRVPRDPFFSSNGANRNNFYYTYICPDPNNPLQEGKSYILQAFLENKNDLEGDVDTSTGVSRRVYRVER